MRPTLPSREGHSPSAFLPTPTCLPVVTQKFRVVCPKVAATEEASEGGTREEHAPHMGVAILASLQDHDHSVVTLVDTELGPQVGPGTFLGVTA